MLFHEIYGYYYQTVAAILEAAVNGDLTDRKMTAIVAEKAFGESALTIPAALKDGTWPLLKEDFTTPLKKSLSMPLSTLEKRWLKTLLSDERIALFEPDITGLDDVEPLYSPSDIVYFDRYEDGDPYSDPKYIKHFRAILKAVQEYRWIFVRFEGHRSREHEWECAPYRIEYSSKDDKFRVLANGRKKETLIINIARVTACEILEQGGPADFTPRAPRKRKLIMELTDERKALERCMLHFSHFEKETERIGEDRYRITLHYDRDDETEMVIRVLSFGPMLKVIAPERFISSIKKRLNKQKKLRTLFRVRNEAVDKV